MPQRVLDFLSRPEVWAVAASLCGFLTLTWVLRGAPLGQSTREEPEGSPASGYRDRFVGAAVIGFLLVLAGAYLAAMVAIPWSLPAFAAGFGIVLAVLRINRRYRHVSPTLRRVLEFSNSALTASLLGGILVVGNVVAFKYGGRALDLTRDQAFSLSSRTLSVLQTLERPVTFTVFFPNSPASIRQHDQVQQLLDLYKAANPSRIRVDYFDPNLDSKEFEALHKRVPDILASPGGGIVFEYGEGTGAPLTFIPIFELFEAQGSRFEAKPDRFVSTFRGEDVVTSALIRVREGKRSRIAFTTGHSELSPGELDPSQPGVGVWRSRLASVGIDVVEANLLRGDLPESISLLVICGPRSPFQPDELERIKSFIVRGGQLIIMLGNTEPSGLAELLNTYNVEIGQGITVDPLYNFRNRPALVYAPIPQGSRLPIVDSLAGRLVLVPNAAPLKTFGGPPKPGTTAPAKASNPSIAALPILRTSPESWAESNLNERPLTKDPSKDQVGPITVGVAVAVKPQSANEKPTPRMVIFSSANLADNTVVQFEPTNLDLLMNAVHWLKGRPDLVGIEAKTHESLMFAADPGLRFRLVMVPTLLAVVVIVGLGTTTYLARRD